MFISCPEKTDLSGNPDIIDCGRDEEMFMGLAALRGDNDNYQWFTDGQYWQLSDVESWYDEDGDAPEEGSPNRVCWWKCTAGEIEARFSPMDLQEVRCDLYDAGFDVTDISDAKIQELIDEIHPLTRLGSHYWTELDRQAAEMGFPDF